MGLICTCGLLFTCLYNITLLNKLYISESAPCGFPKRCAAPEPPDGPMSLEDSNIDELERFIRSSTFNTCSHQPLPLFHGPPQELTTDPTNHTPATLPVHWMEKVKHYIEKDVALGVLEWVPLNTPVTWCHRLIVVCKHNGEIRSAVDMQNLNDASKRQTHHTQWPFQQASIVSLDTYKTVTDAWNGYHSVAIKQEDRHLTTFITPWRRLRYCPAPQGYLSSGDAYTHIASTRSLCTLRT